MISIYVNGLSGKMGQSVKDVIAQNKNISINDTPLSNNHDVVIDFSRPASTINLLNKCTVSNTPIIIGTTGFSKEEFSIINQTSSEIPILLGYNFSRGVNFLKKILSEELNQKKTNYICEINETHHKAKVDSPSGTALEIEELISQKSNIVIKNISSVRTGKVIGIHEIVLKEKFSKSYRHEALKRDIFARGAIAAIPSLIKSKPGLYRYYDL